MGLSPPVILLSGGSGARFGSDEPKQFALLGGRPLLLHSLLALRPLGGPLVVVAPTPFIERTRTLLNGPDLGADACRLVAGGATRQASTLCGLRALFGDYEVPDGTPVVLHDGARPFLQQDEIDRLLAAFRNPQVEVASLARPIPETLVVAGAIPGPITGTVDRELYFSIQTPQAARAGVLRSLMNEAPGDQFTDLLTYQRGFQANSRVITTADELNQEALNLKR